MGWRVQMGKALVVVAVVFLVVTATGCSRKRQPLNTHGLSYCDGAMGKFDVYTYPKQGGFYDIYIVPYQPAQPGDLVSIFISNQNLDNPKELVSQKAIQADDVIYVGAVSTDELQANEVLTITPYSGSAFLQGNFSGDAQLCTLPVPGDNPVAQ